MNNAFFSGKALFLVVSLAQVIEHEMKRRELSTNVQLAVAIAICILMGTVIGIFLVVVSSGVSSLFSSKPKQRKREKQGKKEKEDKEKDD